MDSQKFFRYAMAIIIALIALFSFGIYVLHHTNSVSQKPPAQTAQKSTVDTELKTGTIKANSIVAVDNDAFMELSYLVEQENILAIMRMEREGKVFVLRSPARCQYEPSVVYDGVVVVVIEDGEHALKGGITWKTFIQ